MQTAAKPKGQATAPFFIPLYIPIMIQQHFAGILTLGKKVQKLSKVRYPTADIPVDNVPIGKNEEKTMKTKKIYLSALTSLAVLAASNAAVADQVTTAPELEGGVTASLGAMWVVPSVANDDYGTSVTAIDANTLSTTTLNVDPDYEWGMLASLGYVFDNTANMVELSYRGLFDSSSSSSASAGEDTAIIPQLPNESEEPFQIAKSSLDIEHHGLDLMFSQFMNLGEHTQVRFSAGVSYVDFEQKQTSDFGYDGVPFKENGFRQEAKTDFSGFGPRVGIDGRYDFGQGFGIVAGGSAAYLVGDLDTSLKGVLYEKDTVTGSGTSKNNKSDHAVTNLRGNIGIDYVYFFDNEERSTIGIELGYMADWYDDMSGEIEVGGVTGPESFSLNYDTNSVSFTGPYLLVKGAF